MTDIIVKDTKLWVAKPNKLKAGTMGTHMKYIDIKMGHNAIFLNIYFVLYE